MFSYMLHQVYNTSAYVKTVLKYKRICFLIEDLCQISYLIDMFRYVLYVFTAL